MSLVQKQAFRVVKKEKMGFEKVEHHGEFSEVAKISRLA